MRIDFAFLTFAALMLTASAAAQQRFASAYTDISGKACTKHVDEESTGAYTLDCPGVRGYRLHVLQDDERSSITIVAPDKRIHPLDYWEVVTRGFSSLGNKAEWRLRGQGPQSAPVALIVRVNTSDQSDPNQSKRVSVLAVARIAHDTACVTHIVNASSPNANEQARRFADDIHAACLPRESNLKTSTKG